MTIENLSWPQTARFPFFYNNFGVIGNLFGNNLNVLFGLIVRRPTDADTTTAAATCGAVVNLMMVDVICCGFDGRNGPCCTRRRAMMCGCYVQLCGGILLIVRFCNGWWSASYRWRCWWIGRCLFGSRCHDAIEPDRLVENGLQLSPKSPHAHKHIRRKQANETKRNDNDPIVSQFKFSSNVQFITYAHTHKFGCTAREQINHFTTVNKLNFIFIFNGNCRAVLLLLFLSFLILWQNSLFFCCWSQVRRCTYQIRILGVSQSMQCNAMQFANRMCFALLFCSDLCVTIACSLFHF